MKRNIGQIGRLVVFEGPDGVGKSTIANALADHYARQGIKSECLAFPGNEVGTLGYLVYNIHHYPQRYGIERIAAASLQLLHIAAHIDAIENRIRPLLAEGHYLILDRYWWSTWVYGLVTGADLSVIKAMIEVEKIAWAEIQPFLVVVVDRDQSLRADEPNDRWQEVRLAYHNLVINEKHNYPVVTVKNESTASGALEKVIGILDKESGSTDEK